MPYTGGGSGIGQFWDFVLYRRGEGSSIGQLWDFALYRRGGFGIGQFWEFALYRRGVRYRTFLGRVFICAATLSYTGGEGSGIGLYRQNCPIPEGVRYRTILGFCPIPEGGGSRYRTFLGMVFICAAALSYTGPPSGIGLYRQIALYRRGGVRYRAILVILPYTGGGSGIGQIGSHFD